MTVTIDTREQTPWSFPGWVKVQRGTLPTGDYALAGDIWAVERKSLDDFLGSVSSGWERFGRELDRMDGWPAKVIIVEADFAACCFRETAEGIMPPEHSHARLTPAFACSRIAELTMRGVSVLFAGEPGQAAALCYHLLRQREMAVMLQPREPVDYEGAP